MTNITIQQNISLPTTSFVTLSDAYTAIKKALQEQKYSSTQQVFSVDQLVGVVRQDYSQDYKKHLVSKYA